MSMLCVTSSVKRSSAVCTPPVIPRWMTTTGATSHVGTLTSTRQPCEGRMRPDDLPDRLRHVRWIGGGSGAGKSTIAARIAARHGLQVYLTDKVMPDHARRSTPEDAPSLSLFKAMDMDERWLNRS